MSDEATPKPIDFSALDPSRNQLRWTRTIDHLAARAWAERRRRLSVEHQLLCWARPALVAAAALCLMVWTAGYFAASRGTAGSAGASTAPALVLATWAANHQIPEASDLFGILGDNP